MILKEQYGKLSLNFPFYYSNFKTFQDIFTKFGTNINHHQTMRKETRSVTPPIFSVELHSFEIFGIKLCPFCNFKTIEYFYETWYKYKPPLDDVQRT